MTEGTAKPTSEPASAAAPPPESGTAPNAAKPSWKTKLEPILNRLKKLRKPPKVPSAPKNPAVADDDEGLAVRIQKGFVYLVRGLFARDRPTLASSWLFWASLVALGTVSTVAVQRTIHWYRTRGPTAEQLAAQTFEQREKKRLEIISIFERSIGLGVFTLELKDPVGKRLAPGTMNVAEVEIVLECDHADTMRSIELQPQRVKDQITLALTPLDREDLLTGDGKKRIKRAIIDRVNSWLTTGRVVNVYFERILIL